MKISSLLLALAGAFLSALPVHAQSTAAAASVAPNDATQKLHQLFKRYWEDTAKMYPEWATWRADHRYADRLTDASPAGRAAQEAQTRAWLAEARAIPREPLNTTDRVSREIFIDSLEENVEMFPFTGYRRMSLRSQWGFQTSFSGLMQAVSVSSPERVDQLLLRFAAYPQRVDQEIDALRSSAALGWVPPKSVLERVLSQIDGQINEPIETNGFYVPFTRLPKSWPEAQRQALQSRGREAITSTLLPALRKLRGFVANELMPKATASGAYSDYPDGARVYAMLAKRSTTTTLTPAQIHAIGQRELSRLRAEMEAVMKETKFSGSFSEFVAFLNSDPRFFHKTAEAMLAGYRDIAKRLDAELPKLFAELPRAPYGISPMPAHLGNAAEYYSGPPQDGSRAGVFWANVVALNKRPIWGMETLVAHEAVPGHHLQSARAIELRGLPDFRRDAGFTAYDEGWALYAETLGFDLGLYTDPYSRFGHLQWQAFRAARLIVDTGIHTMGWKRQQAIDFMVERTGVEREFVESEVDRYTSLPGQALSYMIGQLKIVELRDRAKAKLGARFDIRKFHNALLDQGAVPLSVLETIIDDWIELQLKEKA
jgi:uncharacterized protein (DUF885 family)